MTDLVGETGDIKSPLYPSSYPSSYAHTWNIVGSDTTKRVALIVRDFQTEGCCDKVIVSLNVVVTYFLYYYILLYNNTYIIGV